MTQLSNFHQPNRETFPSSTPPEELAKRQAQRSKIGERCRVIFDRLRLELIDQYYNWFIAIEPDSGEYLLDPRLEGLLLQVTKRYPDTDVKLTTFRLNKTGFCGRI